MSPVPTPEGDLRARIAARFAEIDGRDWGYDHGFSAVYGLDAETDAFVDAALAIVEPEIGRLRDEVTAAHTRNAVLRAEHRADVAQLTRALSGHLFDGESASLREMIRQELIRVGLEAVQERAVLAEENERLRAEVSRLSGGNTTPKDAAGLVLEFHRAFDLPVGDASQTHNKLRADLIREEAKEAADALEDLGLVEQAKELADLVYVAYGAAVTLGIDLDHAVRLVHAANMSKLVDGKPVMREDGKVLKGPNYAAPDMAPAVGWGSAVATPDDTPAGDMGGDWCGQCKAHVSGSHYHCAKCGQRSGMLGHSMRPCPPASPAGDAAPSADTKYLCPTHWAGYLEGHSWWDETCQGCDHVRARRVLGDEAPAYGKRVFIVDRDTGQRSVAKGPDGPVRHQFAVPLAPSAGGAGEVATEVGASTPRSNETGPGVGGADTSEDTAAVEAREDAEDWEHHATWIPKLPGGAE